MPKLLKIKKKELTRTKSLVGREILTIREDKILVEKMNLMRKQSNLNYEKINKESNDNI